MVLVVIAAHPVSTPLFPSSFLTSIALGRFLTSKLIFRLFPIREIRDIRSFFLSSLRTSDRGFRPFLLFLSWLPDFQIISPSCFIPFILSKMAVGLFPIS